MKDSKTLKMRNLHSSYTLFCCFLFFVSLSFIWNRIKKDEDQRGKKSHTKTVRVKKNRYN
jgi:hypothetical protein